MLIDPQRRRLLAGAAAALAAPSFPARAAPAPSARTLRVTQLLDSSAAQQELSRDYATGVRLAFAEFGRGNARAPRLVSLETDGSTDSLNQLLRSIAGDASQVALLGTAGEQLALSSIAAAKQLGLEIAHIAPWLADTRFDSDAQVFPLFASREAQIEHALRSLSSSGVTELGLVYADPAIEHRLQPGIARLTAALQLKSRRYTVAQGQDASAYAAALPADSPAILLFLGGTIELALFTQGLSRRRLQRYVVCLSDVDTTTLMQLGPGPGVPLILTQVVPNPQSSSLPVARAYRAALKQLFDEAPSPVSLAGYLAGRYAVRTLARLDAGTDRAGVLAEFQRRPALDLGGYRVDFAKGARGSAFVDQTLLQANGKLVG